MADILCYLIPMILILFLILWIYKFSSKSFNDFDAIHTDNSYTMISSLHSVTVRVKIRTEVLEFG